MKLFISIIFILLFSNFNKTFADNHDQVIFWDQSSGGWDIYIDTTIDYGCFAHMEWKGNTQMRFGFDPTVDSMYITISDSDWRSLQVGKDYDLQIEFDNSQPWTTTAQAITLDGINSLYFTFYEQDFIAEFAKKHSIYVTYNNKEIVDYFSALKESTTFLPAGPAFAIHSSAIVLPICSRSVLN